MSVEQPKEHGHAANWRTWLGHLKDKPGVVGIELGSWKGESAEWFCRNIVTTRDSTLLCVDTFKGSAEHAAAGVDCSVLEAACRQRLIDFAQAEIVKMASDLFLRGSFGNGTPYVDFVYIDAAHDAMNVLRDSVLAFDLLKVGGVMIWDDYFWEVMEAPVDRPKLAIDAFLLCYARRLEVIGLGGQVAVRKVA